LSISIQACSMGSKTSALDMALTTAAVPSAPPVFPDEGLAADGQAILTALSTNAPAEEATGLSWENPDSGARGLITAYAGDAEEGQKCFAFTTTRESFDGISLYEGKACKDSAGILRMRAFAPR
jgi:hypothetical protein